MRKLLPLLLIILTLLTSCASSGREGAEQTASAPADGLVIRLDELTDEISFADCMSGQTAMRLIVRKDASGAVSLAYNTCQSCSGSPYAYYEVVGSCLVCRNCGNAFAPSAVGRVSGGCNPQPVEAYEADGTRVSVSEAALASAAPMFKNWKGAQ